MTIFINIRKLSDKNQSLNYFDGFETQCYKNDYIL